MYTILYRMIWELMVYAAEEDWQTGAESESFVCSGGANPRHISGTGGESGI
jgi:hypothetical protein